MYLLPDLYDRQTLGANYRYYTPRTDHTFGSSLGPSIQAIMACRVGDPSAYEHFMRAARADLLDVRNNAGDGIHGASAGGLWQAVVFGFAGLRFSSEDQQWHTHPTLPHGWKRIAFKINIHGKELSFDVHA
jgi:kojibiose phosphorylase